MPELRSNQFSLLAEAILQVLNVDIVVLNLAYQQPLIYFHTRVRVTDNVINVLATFISDAVAVEAHHPTQVPAKTLKSKNFSAGIVFPVNDKEELLGGIGLFNKKEDLPELDTLEQQVLVYQKLFANSIRNFYSNRDHFNNTDRALLNVAKAIMGNPSPQHVVDVLQKEVLTKQVSACFFLQYGPMHEDKPNGPFDYLEAQGSWIRMLGSGVGTGMRLYLKDYQDILHRLDRESIILIPNWEELAERIDPFLRGMLKSIHLRSIILIALTSKTRKLGVLMIAGQRSLNLSRNTIATLQSIAEFLTYNTVSQLLQIERDRVQQGRAALLESVQDGVVMIVPPNSAPNVLTVNRRFLEIFSLDAHDASGIPLSTLLDRIRLPESRKQSLRDAWSISIMDTQVRQGEFSYMHSQGYPIEIEWYSAPVYQDEQILGRIITFHDITPQRTAYRLRIAFLSRVSHELRTPLTSIRGFSDFILEATGDQLPPLAKEYLEIIRSSALHLNALFNDILQLTEADLGELKLNKGHHSLDVLVLDVVSRLLLQIQERNQKVNIQVSKDLPLIDADYDRIVQVFTNLISNATKYAPEGTEITITAEYVENIEDYPPMPVTNDISFPAIFITVLDQGKGLTRNEVDEIFIPFFRTDLARQQRIEGVGLGLSIVRSIIERHQGKVWAVSCPPASGGCFMFTLPTVRKTKKAKR